MTLWTNFGMILKTLYSTAYAHPGKVRYQPWGLPLKITRSDVEAEGIDFAAEMVVQCEANARAAGVSARFLGGSFFETQFGEHAYDVISAQGFIEYLSPDETDKFFRRSANMPPSALTTKVAVAQLGTDNPLALPRLDTNDLPT